MADWTRQEVELTVQDYFSMFQLELARKPCSKADHRKQLLPKLNNRSDGSVEFKHQNISAVLLDMGLPYIKGYQPRKNYQGILKDVVSDYLNRNPEWFQQLRSLASGLNFPIESYSWRILSPSIFVKDVDKSALLHDGSGIPMEIRSFFGIEDMTVGEQREVTLCHGGGRYQAHFVMDRQPNPRTQLLWSSPFSKLLQEEFPRWHKALSADIMPEGEPPKIRFVRKDAGDSYDVEFINPGHIESDIAVESEEEFTPGAEGKVKYFYSKQYERNPANRKKAIEIHGQSCVICGFNFGEFYGEWGEGYIEAHHTVPLSSLDEEVVVNPETDLFPVCANCHRILHRRKDKVLTISELKDMIRKSNDR